jgi:hypothetical protein
MACNRFALAHLSAYAYQSHPQDGVQRRMMEGNSPNGTEPAQEFADDGWRPRLDLPA